MDVTVGLDVVIRVNTDNLVSHLPEADPTGFSGKIVRMFSSEFLQNFYQFVLLHKLHTEFGTEDLFSHAVNFMQQKVE